MTTDKEKSEIAMARQEKAELVAEMQQLLVILNKACHIHTYLREKICDATLDAIKTIKGQLSLIEEQYGFEAKDEAKKKFDELHLERTRLRIRRKRASFLDAGTAAVRNIDADIRAIELKMADLVEQFGPFEGYGLTQDEHEMQSDPRFYEDDWRSI